MLLCMLFQSRGIPRQALPHYPGGGVGGSGVVCVCVSSLAGQGIAKYWSTGCSFKEVTTNGNILVECEFVCSSPTACVCFHSGRWQVGVVNMRGCGAGNISQKVSSIVSSSSKPSIELIFENFHQSELLKSQLCCQVK